MHIIAFRPPDATWEKMKAVWDACQAADVPVPRDVEKFFNDGVPDAQGVEVPLSEACLKPFQHAFRSGGYEVHVDQLPLNVRVIRFYNTW